MSQLKNLIKIVTSPRETFNSLGEKPNPWFPFLFGILVSLGMAIVTVTVFYPHLLKEAMARIEKLEEAQRQGAMAFLSYPRMLITTISAVIVGGGLWLLLLAVIYQLLLPTVGGIINWKGSFTVVAYAHLISVYGDILKLPLVLLKKSKEIFTDLRLFLPFLKEGSFLYNLSAKIDIFTIFSLLVLSIGLEILGKVTKKKAYFLVFALWVIFILVLASLSLIIPKGQ